MEANYRCPVSTTFATKPVSVARKPEVLLAPTEHVAQYIRDADHNASESVAADDDDDGRWSLQRHYDNDADV